MAAAALEAAQVAAEFMQRRRAQRSWAPTRSRRTFQVFDDWPLFASLDQPWQWLCVARQPWHVASPKRPSHGGRRLDFMGGGQKVKGAVGRLRLDFWNSRRREPCSATRLPACLRALLTPFRPATRDLAAEAETVEILQVALSERGRQQLQTAGKRAGVKVLLSRENGRRFEFADI